MRGSEPVPKIAISAEQCRIVRAILGRILPGRSVWAFGSRVRGTARPYSDLDLAILGDEPVPIAAMAEAKEAFSESDLPWRVDLVDWASLNPRFRELIAREHSPLLDAQAALVDS